VTPDATPTSDQEAQPQREQIVERASALVPVLRERAPETERMRRIPDETMSDLHDAGLWRVLRPERFGGWITDIGVMIDVGIELARGCASTSWVYMNLIAHNWMLPYWSKQAEDDVWGENPQALISSTLVFPAGRLEPVEGGYLFSGRWPYASGVEVSEWIMLGAMVGQGVEASPAPRIVMIRCSDVTVIDTWHVSGLCGTGSHDVACENVFIPEHMVLDPRHSQEGYTPGTEELADAYKLPLVPFIPHLVAAPMIGIAQAVYDDYVAFLNEQTSIYNKSKVGEHVTVQLKVAEAGQLVDTARLLVREDLMEAHRLVAEQKRPSLLVRAKWRRSAAFASGLCVRAVDLLHEVRGATANYLSTDLQRQHRDIHAAKHQIHLSWDINGAEFGRIAVGLEPTNKML
jgi:3-hydroxy-9,10-secoandrosta-1,3,5(10)-triene-9,17-dione monooxygenase